MYSSNVKEAPYLKQTKHNSISKVRKWDGTYLRYGFFLLDDQILNLAATFQKCKKAESLNFLLFNFCNSCLFVEVSNNEIFDFLTSNSCFLNFSNGGSMTNVKVHQGSMMTKRLKI